ncbi:MAG: TonB-dependent receptor family protein [Chitinophagaceae bacterium]|nr:TonB-dependent receptor family protein [Chitinophagaceae bacterium]
MKKILFVFFCSPFACWAERVTISIQDIAKKPIEVAVVVSDSNQQFVGGGMSEQGLLNLELEPTMNYHFQFSSASYEHLDTTIRYTSGSTLTFYLAEKTNALKTVTVKTSKPVFEKSEEGTRINVQQSMLSKSPSMQELVSRLPGIAIVQNKLQLIGKGELLLVVDGKEATYDMLRSIPPNQLKSIEIITNPGVKYDAKGKALLVVQTKKSYRQGASLILTESLQWNRVLNRKPLSVLYNTTGLVLNIRKDKWLFSSSFNNEYGISWMENKFENRFTYPNQVYINDGYYTEDALSKKVFYYRCGISYKTSKRSSISIQYDGLAHDFDLEVMQHSDYLLPEGKRTTIHMDNDANTRLSNNSLNINYLLELDSTGSSLFIAAQANRFQNKLLDRIHEQITDTILKKNNFDRINDSKNSIWLYTFQADHRIKHKLLSLESGIKLSYASNEGHIRFLSKQEEYAPFEEVSSKANGTLYKEIVPAAYSNLQWHKEKVNFNVGLRAEYSKVTDYSFISKQKFIDTSYFNLFPSAKLAYTISGSWSVNASYSRKISRPIYQDLDPFLWYLDSLTSIQGNPMLKPEYLNQYEFRCYYKSYLLRTSYTYANQTQWAIGKPGNQGLNSYVYLKENIQHRTITTLATELPINYKKYASYQIISWNVYRFSDNRPEFKPTKPSPQWYIYSFHQLQLPYKFSTECTFEFYGASSDGFTKKNPYYYASIGISRSILREQLAVQILWNDIFRTAQLQGVRTLNTITTNYNQRYSTNYIRIGLTWNFNRLIQFNYQNKSVNESEYNRIKK